MQWLRSSILTCAALCACGEHDLPDDATDSLRSSTTARIASAQQALAGVYIPTIDPQTMHRAEISKALGPGPYCAFRYTSAGKPVLALKQRAGESQMDGLVKLNGYLITLQNQPNADALTAGDVNLRMTFPNANQGLGTQATKKRDADLLFLIDHRLRVGYRGYYACNK